MTTKAEGKTLVEKIIAVAAAVPYIEKGGTNSAQNYKFVGEAQVVEKVGPLLAEQGILVYPIHSLVAEPKKFTTAKGSVQFLTTIQTVWVFTDGVDEIKVVTIGQGTDAGDKGVYKAMTGSKKYGLLQALMIATGDDPEDARPDERDGQQATATPATRTVKPRGAKGNSDAPITDAQKRLIRAKANEAGVSNDQLSALRLKVTGKHSSAQMTNGDVDKLVEVLGDHAQMAAIITDGELVA